MRKFNPNIHNRKSIRLEGYDYSSAGAYFITLCCRERAHLFGEIIYGSMELNQLGEIIEEEWIRTIEIRSHISLGEWVVMPNHFHGIIHIEKDLEQNPEHIGKFRSPSQTIGAIIRGFKGATTKRIKELIFNRPDLPERANCDSPQRDSPLSGIDPEKSIWQRDYWDNIIRNQRAYDNIINYIRNNPKKWEEDKFNQ